MGEAASARARTAPVRGLLAPHLEGVRAYVPGKPIQELERELGIRDAVKLASNENPLGPSPAAVSAVREAASGVHRYPDNHAHALRTALARRHGVALDEIVLGAGSNEIIDLLCRTFGGAHAVIGRPSFVSYALCLRLSNVAFTEVPLRGEFAWDVDALLAAVRPETRLVFIDHPNNPTGVYVPASELARWLAALPDHVVPVLDEAYVHYADAPDFTSALALRDRAANLVVLRTFSKAYGLAALRVGYAVAPNALAGYLERVRLPFNVGGVGQAAACAALGDAAHLERTVVLNRSERARLATALAECGFRVAPSQANFLCTLPPGNMDAATLYDALLRRGVIVRPLGAPLERWLRISVGLPDENTRLLDALRDLVP